jgi:hypothetical protein
MLRLWYSHFCNIFSLSIVWLWFLFRATVLTAYQSTRRHIPRDWPPSTPLQELKISNSVAHFVKSPLLLFSCFAASRSAPACLSQTVPHSAWWCTPRRLVTETHPTTWPIVSALFHIPWPRGWWRHSTIRTLQVAYLKHKLTTSNFCVFLIAFNDPVLTACVVRFSLFNDTSFWYRVSNGRSCIWWN